MEVIRRGDLVTVAVSGDYGKPRPALVVQSNAYQALPSVTILCLTSDFRDRSLLRVTIEPSPVNGLRKRSQVMIDKALTLPREKIGGRIGSLETAAIQVVDEMLRKFLELG